MVSRNIDVEPFSGLCMHPVEHLLYWFVSLMPCAVLVNTVVHVDQ